MAEELNRHFSKEDTGGQQAHEKMLSLTHHQDGSHNHGELPPLACQNGSHETDKTSASEDVVKGDPAPVGRSEDGSNYCGGSSKKLKTGLLSTGSNNSTSEYIPTGNENRNLARCVHPHFYCCTVHSYQDTDTAQMPISRWMDKKDIHIHSGLFFSHEKKKYPPMWDSIEHIVLSEMSQTDKDKCCMTIILLCGI